MNNLPKIIGPAPSEVSPEEYLPRLRAERDRVSSMLSDFRERMSGLKAPRSSSSAKPKKIKVTEEMLRELERAIKGEQI